MAAVCQQNYAEECASYINKHVNLELYASYVYLSMSFHFDRDDVALPGVHAYFKKAADEEKEHAEKLMKYQNKRGGKIKLESIQKPPRDEWGTVKEAFETALELEKTVNQSLLKLHAIAGSKADPHLADFLEEHYLDEQVNAIKELSDHITNIKRVGDGLGIFLFDKELQK